MRLHRALLATVLAGSLFATTGCVGETRTENARTSSLAADEAATYEYVVPFGTGDRIDSGEQVELMPRTLNVKVGESIRIDNQDTRGFMIGPFFVGARQKLGMQFTNTGTLSGECSMNPEGEFTIVVSD